MEEKSLSNVSEAQFLVEVNFPTGDGPQPHTVRFLDPREVENHFAPLLKNCPSPEQRWAGKSNATPFLGL